MFKSNEHCICILISQYDLSYDIPSSLLLKDQTLLLKITIALSFDCFCWYTLDENSRIHFKSASNYAYNIFNLIWKNIVRIPILMDNKLIKYFNHFHIYWYHNEMEEEKCGCANRLIEVNLFIRMPAHIMDIQW